MRKMAARLGMVAMFVLVAIVAQAQTCPGNLAEMISPTNGSVLPAGAVTFEWCDAAADYFLTVETCPGCHDLFNAVVPKQTFVTLGPACAPSQPYQCIPPNGEAIHVALWTSGKQGQWLGPNVYAYTAANPTPAPPAATNTTVGNASAIFSASPQSVTLTATVTSSASPVNQGAVTFQVMDGTANVGAAVTSATLTAGNASVTYLLPGGTTAKSYTIQATYSGGTSFDPSSGSGTLTVNPPPPAPIPTTTTVNPQTVTFSNVAQNVTLTATVGAASAVNEGTVTFQVVDAASNLIGTAATSATVTNGSASAIYALPAGLPAAGYTIQAAYSGGSNFDASSGSGNLTVNAAPPPIQLTTATNVGSNAVTFSSGIQHVTLTAVVEVPGVIVNEGTVTFQVMDGAINVGTAVPSAALTDGNASVSYPLPAATVAKAYTVQAAYSGGIDFLASNGSATLTINQAASTTHFTSTAPGTLTLNQTYTPTATSTGDGVLTMGASGACSIAGGVVTITDTTGTCTVTATESAGTNFLGSSAAPQSITVLSDFSFPTNPAPVSISAPGGSGSTTLTITGQPGYSGTINFTSASCAGLPAKSACSFNPASVTGPGSTTITITTTAPQTAMLNGAPNLKWWTTGGGITLAGVFLAGIPGKRGRWSKLLGLLVIAFLLTSVGCGGGSSHVTIPGTPPGSFTVTVTGTSGTLTHSTTFTLNVQ
jgi:Big-like domain-containing protein